MRNHPSMFTPELVSDCEGSFMPNGAIYLTEAQAEAVAQINEALDALNDDSGIRSSSMMRQRDVQAEAWDTVSDPKDAA